MSEALLELATGILGPLVDDVVFVGGATVHLWLTEAAAPPVRATDDVDVICDVTSYGEYEALAERLRERELEEAIDEPVICRWRHRDSGLAIDVMPISEEVLGFSNPWYQLGIETAVERTSSIRRADPGGLTADCDCHSAATWPTNSRRFEKTGTSSTSFRAQLPVTETSPTSAQGSWLTDSTRSSSAFALTE